MLGRHRKAGAAYHNVPEEEKKLMHDFIKARKAPPEPEPKPTE
jgi:hypothetical protein